MNAAHFVALDPGRDTGWCAWDAYGRLLSCGLGEDWPGARVALIERPKVYPAAHSKGDPNDLITLAIRVGKYTERLEVAGATVQHVLPRDWKGTVDKDVMCNRIVARLSPEEARIVRACNPKVGNSKIHNVIDAIGLGKWALSTRKWKVSGA